MNNNEKNKGFTLVELIVIIIALGILAVVAASKYMNYKIEAKNATLRTLAASLKFVAFLIILIFSPCLK